MSFNAFLTGSDYTSIEVGGYKFRRFDSSRSGMNRFGGRPPSATGLYITAHRVRVWKRYLEEKHNSQVMLMPSKAYASSNLQDYADPGGSETMVFCHVVDAKLYYASGYTGVSSQMNQLVDMLNAEIETFRREIPAKYPTILNELG